MGAMMAESGKEMNPSIHNNDVDFVTSVAFFWRIRFYLLFGLAIGGMLSLVVILSLLREKIDLISTELYLVASSTETDGIIPPGEVFENFLLSRDNKQVFIDSLKENLKISGTDA